MDKPLSFVCRYTPLELFAGFDVPMVRLDPAPRDFDCADSCAHPNLCGYGKAVLEEVRARDIKRLILVDCCDVIRRVYDVLKAGGTMDFLYLLPLPHKSGEGEIRLLAAELKALRDAWKAHSGQDFDLTKAIAAWSAGEDAPTPDGPYISLAGAHGGRLLREAAQGKFAVPVVDETCTGARLLPSPGAIASEEDFFSAYAAALLRQGRPCMRMLDTGSRDVGSGARGVIYHTVKFCDYYSFEYAARKGEKGAALLKIETDCTPQSGGQLSTRLDAFAETLGLAANPETRKGVRLVAGVDSGSTSTDAVIMDRAGHILGSAILPTGAGAAKGAERALELALADANMTRAQLEGVVTTGYGRATVGLSDDSVTEITCHAKGAHFLYPAARTVIDIGGQDSKVILVDETGGVVNFIMNDKCAAGTGRFLDMMARTLGMTLEEMSARGLLWKNQVTISSMCTVFAESEVVSLVAANTPPEDIIHGLNMAVAGKTAALSKRLGGEPAYVMTGGVAQNQGVVKALEEKLGAPVHVPPEAQLCGAIGAALIALGL